MTIVNRAASTEMMRQKYLQQRRDVAASWGEEKAKEWDEILIHFNKTTVMSFSGALYAATSWLTNSDAIRECFGDEQLGEAQVLARAMPGLPHLNLIQIRNVLVER